MYIADGKFLLHFPTLFQILKLPISFIRAWSVYSLESTAVDSKGHILSNTVVPDIPGGLETNRVCDVCCMKLISERRQLLRGQCSGFASSITTSRLPYYRSRVTPSRSRTFLDAITRRRFDRATDQSFKRTLKCFHTPGPCVSI